MLIELKLMPNNEADQVDAALLELIASAREMILLAVLTKLYRLLQTQGFRSAQILRCMSKIAEGEKGKFLEERDEWDAVVHYLSAAADAAEKKLP